MGLAGLGEGGELGSGGRVASMGLDVVVSGPTDPPLWRQPAC